VCTRRGRGSTRVWVHGVVLRQIRRDHGDAKGSELSKDWFSHLADLKISLAALGRPIHAFRANA